jgi:hypothetical protein
VVLDVSYSPRRKILQLQNIGTKPDESEKKKAGHTHLDVRLLILPGVVSYCFASAKIDAMPTSDK